MRHSTAFPLILLSLLGLAACEQPRPPTPPPPVPVVILPVATEAVPVAVEEVGRAEASNSANLLPRVGGQILTRHFEEGQAVAAGDLLYSVDPATFEAKLRSAEAQLARTQAELKYAQDEADRYAALETKRTVSRSQAEQFTNAAMVLRQAIRAQEAEVEQAVEALMAPYAARKKVLFLCRENACRSQMAGAFAQHLASDRLDVSTGGSRPAEKINPDTVAVMAEKKIDLAFRKPQGIEAALAGGQADAVVTMGCGEECPVAPGALREDWDLPDPSGQPLETMRRVRDEIESRVKQLIATLCG